LRNAHQRQGFILKNNIYIAKLLISCIIAAIANHPQLTGKRQVSVYDNQKGRELMTTSILLILTVAAIAAMFYFKAPQKNLIMVGVAGLVITVFQMGLYYVPAKTSGHVTQRLGASLEGGQLIARAGQRGEQSQLLTPGIGYDIRYPFLMDIKIVPDVVIPSGQFATIKARDGAINPKIVAPRWTSSQDHQLMLENVDYFMANGGVRGIQQFKVTTGNYRLNQFQWDFEFVKMENVDSTEVMVIESKFGKAAAFKETSDDEILSVPLVESTEYRGIVNKAFPSGMYSVHPYTEKAHRVPIMLQTFIYGGGYTAKTMELAIDPDNDKLKTIADEKDIPKQKHGAAFAAKTLDNHTVYIDVRVLGQIEPIQAPRFVGTMKDINKLDDSIIEPYTKNILTNLVLQYNAIDLKNKKEELGNKLSEALRDRTQKTGFRTKTVEITNLDIPPIVLISAKIASASDALREALEKKEASVKQAISVRNMQDQADNQTELALAIVANKSADEKAAQIIKMADANEYREKTLANAARYHISQQALALKDMSKVIGADRAADLMIQEKINEAAGKFKGPEVYVAGGSGSDGQGVVAAHMLSKAIKSALKAQLVESGK
jgi:hypothetical protein